MATMVTTVTPSLLHMVVLPISMEQYRVELDHLGQIMKEHIDANDPLSLKIHDWGVRVFQLANETDAELLKHGHGLINELVQKILINPLDGSPLQCPILDGIHVWEKWMLDDYATLSLNSPYDGKPLAVKAHSFAQAIISWIKPHLKPISAGPVVKAAQLGHLHPSMANISPDSAMGATKQFTYYTLAQKAQAIQESQQWQEKYKQAQLLFVEFRVDLEESVRVRVEEMEAKMADHLKNVDERIGEVETTHAATRDVLKDNIVDLDKRLDRSENGRVLAERKNVEHQQRISTLEHQLHSAHQRLNSMSGGGGGGCTIL